MVNLGVLENDQGNPEPSPRLVQAGRQYQQPRHSKSSTARTTHSQPTRKRSATGRALGRYGYLAYADPTLLEHGNSIPDTPKPIAADYASEPAPGSSDDDRPN